MAMQVTRGMQWDDKKLKGSSKVDVLRVFILFNERRKFKKN